MNPTAPVGPPAPLVGRGQQTARGPAWPSFPVNQPEPPHAAASARCAAGDSRPVFELAYLFVRGTAAAGTGSVAVLRGAQAQYVSPSTK
jgi:hypothetical protein